MTDSTRQMQAWQGAFGKEYTDRHALSVAELDDLYLSNYGISRNEMNRRFLGTLDRSLRILEVGANLGTQLKCLQATGFQSLTGIELQPYAVERARATVAKIEIVQGSAFEIPFADGAFDLVFTSGVLIHITPTDIARALREIERCSARYIWGFEYFAERYTEVNYRGHDGLLWKTDFATLYAETLPGLTLIQEQRYKYLDNDNVDTMFLLEKNPRAAESR